jgi:hypothetical protein
MRTLWVHRSVEMLQNRMTIYLHSVRRGACPVARHEISQEWNKIKKEMDEILTEMDREAKTISRPQVYATGDLRYGTPSDREPQ